MTASQSLIKTVLALAATAALSFGGVGMASAHSLHGAETSVDSGIVGGGSNQGMHPHSAVLELVTPTSNLAQNSQVEADTPQKAWMNAGEEDLTDSGRLPQ